MPDLKVGRALVAVAALVAFGAGAQTMYKWKDEKGVTHFSEQPPPDDKKGEKVTPKVTPPSGSGAYDPNAWKNLDAEARKRQIERGTKEQADAKDDAKRKDVCDRARSRIAFVQTGVIYHDNPDGSRTFMTEAQRESELARLREVVNQTCR